MTFLLPTPFSLIIVCGLCGKSWELLRKIPLSTDPEQKDPGSESFSSLTLMKLHSCALAGGAA